MRLEAAEALYGGDFLEEDLYEDWAVGLREEAQATYISIARSLAEAAAADGDADGATRYYLRSSSAIPTTKGAHLGLVSALVAAGRHGEARRRYGFYAAKMEEIAVEAAPFPGSTSAPPAAAPAAGHDPRTLPGLRPRSALAGKRTVGFDACSGNTRGRNGAARGPPCSTAPMRGTTMARRHTIVDPPVRMG